MYFFIFYWRLKKNSPRSIFVNQGMSMWYFHSNEAFLYLYHELALLRCDIDRLLPQRASSSQDIIFEIVTNSFALPLNSIISCFSCRCPPPLQPAIFRLKNASNCKERFCPCHAPMLSVSWLKLLPDEVHFQGESCYKCYF